MASQRFVLSTGSEIPALGIDTSTISSRNYRETIEDALRDGYRHFRVTSGHHNEESIGGALEAAMSSKGIPRNKIFITVTIPCTLQTVAEKSLDRSLAALRLEYADLCLMFWEGNASSNGKSHVDVYKDLENLKRRWKTRAVGVVNFSLESLQDLVPQVSMKPAVNQVDVSLSQHDEKLVDYCNWNGLLVLASKPANVDPGSVALVKNMANDYETTPENIILSWHTSSRRAVLLESIASKTAPVELKRGDVYKLDELSSKGQGSSATSKFMSLMPESGLNLLDKAGFTRPETKNGRVLPVL